MHFFEKKVPQYLQMWDFFCIFAAKIKNSVIMNAVVYNTVEEKRSARTRLIAIKEAVEQQMRQRMTKMEW